MGQQQALTAQFGQGPFFHQVKAVLFICLCQKKTSL